MVALLVAFAGNEWARLCGRSGASAWLYGGLAALLYVGVAMTDGLQARAVFAVASVFWVLVVPVWLGVGLRAQQRPALALSGFVVIVPAALALTVLSAAQALLVLALVWAADTAAYFVGRRWGRRKLAPSISPGKTREGAAGGIAAALAYAIICGSFVEGIAWGVYLAGALLAAALSVVGDLFESAAKRQAGLKDSGTLLPGHGGILDRIDSATATLPFAALLVPFVRANG